MSELLPIVMTSLILAVLAHGHSRFSTETGEYTRKDRLFWIIMAVAMIFFVGLRKGYNDTSAYRHGYELIDLSRGILEGVDWKVGSNPGFNVTNNILRHLGFSTQSFLMFYAAVTNGIYLWFIRKYSKNLWASLFFFITMGCYTFTLAAIKQCVAVAFCLIATDRALKKQYVSFVLWVLLATLFHPYSLMYLIVPFLMFRPWSGKTWVMLGAFGLAGVLLQPLLGTVVNITTMLGEEFDISSFSGEGVNPFRLAVVAVPVVLSFITRKPIKEKNDAQNNLFLNLSMLNAEIMFVAMFGTANYFGRLANYFLIFQTLALPWLFTHFEPKSKRFLTVAAIVCYVAYFYYANVINQHFDSIYSAVPLREYLQNILR